jgi:hypothetical protein
MRTEKKKGESKNEDGKEERTEHNNENGKEERREQ